MHGPGFVSANGISTSHLAGGKTQSRTLLDAIIMSGSQLARGKTQSPPIENARVPAYLCAVRGLRGIEVEQYVLRLQGEAEQADHFTILAAEYSGEREE